jgi:hypothetical protein
MMSTLEVLFDSDSINVKSLANSVMASFHKSESPNATFHTPSGLAELEDLNF